LHFQQLKAFYTFSFHSSYILLL